MAINTIGILIPQLILREKEHVEDFVLSLRAHLSEEFSLPVYIIDCDKLSHICVKAPFSVQLLPCIKFLGEQIFTYTGDFLVERVEYWLQVLVFKTRVSERGGVLAPGVSL